MHGSALYDAAAGETRPWMLWWVEEDSGALHFSISILAPQYHILRLQREYGALHFSLSIIFNFGSTILYSGALHFSVSMILTFGSTISYSA